MEEILKELNEQQREAVTYIEGPSLVIAGAGSGKTRVLTYKIAYLLKCGFPPESVMALTFTNKAAREMRSRIGELVGERVAKRLWMGTFHSIFGRILRAEAMSIGFTSSFTIYDTSDTKSLLKSIMKDMKLDDKEYPLKRMMSRISQTKNNLITAEEYASNTELVLGDRQSRIPMFGRVYSEYAKRCKCANAMDFDDMLLYMNILMRDNPEILAKYQNFFQFLLVDEYQDTNFAQYCIVKSLADKHHRLCVVGDDAQSIYSFRGASISNILNFQKNNTNCKLFKLERNYRSTQVIVNAANSLIEKNKNQIRKQVYSENSEGERITVESLYSDHDEANVVAKTILETVRSVDYEEVAILYRTNAQSRVLEESLRLEGIPYRIHGGLSFYQRSEIKDALSYLRLVLNPNDDEAFRRVINTPSRGLGDVTIGKIYHCAVENNTSCWDVIRSIEKYALSINGPTTKKLQSFCETYGAFTKELNEKNAYEIATEVIEKSGLILDALKEGTEEKLSKKSNIEELLKAIYEYTQIALEEDGKVALLSDFMSEVALQTDQDKEEKDNQKKVTMMTVHAAKGLEFKHVFIVGMEDGLFPSSCSGFLEENELEEERRLFYVAITRAKENCRITMAKSRFRNGQMVFGNPSRFIKDINPKYLQMKGFGGIEISTPKISTPTSYGNRSATQSFDYVARASKPVYQPNLKRVSTPIATAPQNNSAVVNGICVGAIVEHQIFGKGTVEEFYGEGQDAQVVVNFATKGVKKLLMKYAKLTVVG